METFATNTVPVVPKFLRGVRYIGLSLFVAASAAYGVDDDGDNDNMELQRHYHHSRFIAFGAYDGTDTELWKTNGRESGTRLVKNIYPGNFISSPRFFVKFKREYFFIASDDTITNGLWRTDGTEAGTVLVTRKVTPANGAVIPPSFQVFRGELYFTVANDPHPESVSGISIWKTDGTDDGTVRVKGLDPGNRNTDEFIEYSPYFAFRNTMYISARDETGGWELWKTDGTETGTILVKNIAPDNPGDINSSFPDNFASFRGKVYFTADDGANGRELWRTDGTEDGTVRITDFARDVSGGAGNLKTFHGSLYFAADDGVNGMELWKTNGTASGTVFVKDIAPGADGSSPSSFTEFKGRLYFSATVSDGTFFPPRLIWKTNGTDIGTRQVAQATVGTNRHVSGRGFAIYRNALYFIGGDTRELWRSNGTEAGTRLVEFIPTPPACTIGDCNGVNMHDFQVINGILLFRAGDAVNGREWWRSDGTEQGTHVLTDICPGPCNSYSIAR